jgi:cardiolipin synthase
MTEWRQMIARELSQDTVGGVSEGNDVQVYFDGDTVYDAMLAAISRAKNFVHLEMYMFLSDDIGQEFAQALSAKAREGISVRVIYDSIGSSDADVMQWAHMRDAGVEVVEYRPVWFWRKRGGLLGRNHRKNLIVDDVTAFTGGMNIGNMWSHIQWGDNAWRDTHLRVKGPAAAQMNQLFVDTWNHSTDETLDAVAHPKKQGPHHQGSRCMVIGSQGLGDRKQMRRLFSVHLEKAERSVKMTMPYFVPPRRLRKSVQRASQRGVDITLLVPRDSDVTIVDWLREGLYPKLLRWGVNVIEYLGPTLHAKTMIIDNDIAVIGSNNFDILSVLMNQETALVVFDKAIVAELEEQWKKDLKLSERVTSNWRGLRPWWRLMMAKLGCFLIRRL